MRPKIRDAVLEILDETDEFNQRDKAHIGSKLRALGFDRAGEEAWLSGVLSVLMGDGVVVEDAHSIVVSYYLDPEGT